MSNIVKFKPSSKQWRAYQLLTDNTTSFVGYGGSIFSGKSYLLAWWVVLGCLQYPDTAWGVGRKELINLKKTTLLTIFKVLGEIGYTSEFYNYNQQQNTITFPNKSVIFLIDTAYQPRDPLYERFGGFELTCVAIDESSESPFKAIEILHTRIGRRNNEKYNIYPTVLETFNPSKNHIYRRYYKPWRDGVEREGYKFVKALPSDNPSPEVKPYIKRIMQTASQSTIQRLVKGDFEYDDSPDILISFNSIVDLWTNTQVSDEDGVMYITIDPARMGKDRAVILVWRGWEVIHINVIDKSTLDQLGKVLTELKNTYGVPNSRIVADSDGLGAGFVDFMQIEGFANGSKATEGNYQNLKTQCYYLLAKKCNDSGIYISVDSHRDLIIEELEQVKSYKQDSDGKIRMLPKDKVKENIGRSPDYSDCMAFRFFFETTGVQTGFVEF